MNEEMRILCVEDSDLDHECVERSLKKLKITNEIVRARDGEGALEIMRGNSTTDALCKPYVVLLDLNMPKMSGVEFLEEIRKDNSLRNTPVFVLTTSDHRRDVEAAYEQNICGYITKPIKRDEMLKAMETLNAYWTLCVFPGA
ncbi:MAG: CheY-like chemotaxis protein [Planctomycetota bacterium]|jgi:CheY-like chemotaxis protein